MGLSARPLTPQRRTSTLHKDTPERQNLDLMAAPLAALLTGLPQLAGELNSSRKILLEIAMNDGCLGVDEARVEMTLEHHQDTLDGRVRREREQSGRL